MRLAVTLRLLSPLTRAIYWLPLLVVTPVAAAMAGVFRLAGEQLSTAAMLLLLRTNGLLLGAAAAFTLADSMAVSTAAVPVPRWLRQWLRTGLAISYAAVAWAATYPIIVAQSPVSIPVRDTTLEAAVCVAVGLAGAGFAVRREPERHGAIAGAATLFALVVASLFLPQGRSPWVSLDAPEWGAVHTGWLLALPLAAAGLAYAHRDTRSG